MPTQKSTNKKATRSTGAAQAVRTNRNKATAKKRWQRRCARSAATLPARQLAKRHRWIASAPIDKVTNWLNAKGGQEFQHDHGAVSLAQIRRVRQIGTPANL